MANSSRSGRSEPSQRTKSIELAQRAGKQQPADNNKIYYYSPTVRNSADSLFPDLWKCLFVLRVGIAGTCLLLQRLSPQVTGAIH